MDRSLEVVIAMSGIFLFLSLIALALVEVLSGILSLRAKDLERGLIRALDGVSNEEAQKTASENDRDDPETLRARAAADPSTLSPSARVLRHPLIGTLGRASGRNMPSYIPAPLFVRAFLDSYTKVTVAGPGVAATVEHAVEHLKPEQRKLVEGILGEAKLAAAEAQQRVEAWFDAAMDRISGVYKRHTQWLTRGLGFLLVLGLNVDAVALVNTMWRDPVARAAAVKLAERQVIACEPKADPATGAAEVAAPTTTCAQLTDELARDPSLVPPLGWTKAAWQNLWTPADPAAIFWKGIGFALSIFAISLGAPFWFDLLRKLAPGVSQAGPKPAVK